jgi:hypothetical protein
MAKPPAEPEPSREPAAWTAEDTYRLLTTSNWTAEQIRWLHDMWQRGGKITFFQVLVRLLKEKVIADALVVALQHDRNKQAEAVANLESIGAAANELAAELQARIAELENPAAALARQRKGTMYEKDWRKLVLASEKAMLEVLDPAVKRAPLARRLAQWLEGKVAKPPQPQTIDRWIKDLRERAAAQAQSQPSV